MNEVLKTALSLSVSGSLPILVLFLCKPLLKNRLSRQWQYYIWLVAIARLLLPLAPETSPVDTLFHQSVPTPTAAVAAPNAALPTQPDGEPSRDAAAPPSPYTPATPTPAAGEGSPAPAEYLWLVWLGAAALLLVRKITVYQNFSRYIRAGCTEVSDTALLDRLAQLGEETGVKRPVELYVNPLASSPMLLGFFRPCIVLPTASLPESDFRCTVLHELTHCRRWDLAYKWLVQLTVCLHWFNPLVWLMAREITRACELACDEAVIAALHPQERRSYGDTLLRAMETGGAYQPSAASVTLHESGEILKERLTAIMNYKPKSKWITALSLALAAALALGAAQAGAYTRNPPETDSKTPSQSQASIPEPRQNNWDYSISGTVFTYSGKAYDLAERDGLVNSILSCKPAENYLVLEGHTGPQHSIYFVFNTNTKTFEKEIRGAHLIWEGEDLTTAVYSFWSDIYDYNGSRIGTCDMEEGDYIYELSLSGGQVSALVLTPEMDEKIFTFPANTPKTESSFYYTQEAYYQPPYLFEIGYNLPETTMQDYAHTDLILPEIGTIPVYWTDSCEEAAKNQEAVSALALLLAQLAEETKNTDFPLARPWVASVQNTGNAAPKTLAERYLEGGSLPQFGAMFALLGEGEQRTFLNKIYTGDKIDFFSIAVKKLPAGSPLMAEFAEKAYADGKIDFFSILANDFMSRETLESWQARAAADGRANFQSVLLNALDDQKALNAMKADLETRLIQEYQAHGITKSGAAYAYQGQPVHIFLDIRADRSLCTLDINPQGVVNVKITRDGDGNIQSVGYLPDTEAQELLADMEGGA